MRKSQLFQVIANFGVSLASAATKVQEIELIVNCKKAGILYD